MASSMARFLRGLQVTSDGEGERTITGTSLFTFVALAIGLFTCLCYCHYRSKQRHRAALAERDRMRHRGSGPPILSPSARLRLASRRNSRNSLGPGAAGGLAAGPPGMAGARGVLGNSFDIDVALPQFGSQSTIKRQRSSRSIARMPSARGVTMEERAGGAGGFENVDQFLERAERANTHHPNAAGGGPPGGGGGGALRGTSRKVSMVSGTTRIPGETPTERKRRLSMLRTCSGLTSFGDDENDGGLVMVGLPDGVDPAERARRLNSFFGRAHIGVAPSAKDLKARRDFPIERVALHSYGPGRSLIPAECSAVS